MGWNYNAINSATAARSESARARTQARHGDLELAVKRLDAAIKHVADAVDALARQS